MSDWETIVGLEIHVHLKTRTKMFCRCELEYFAEPNTRTCPVCLAHPGALPVPNRAAVEHTIKLGLALGCEIADEAIFSRKNYFYPDNPKGYQISQYDKPLCIGGALLVPAADGEREIRFVRAHLEEDAAKTIHVGGSTGRKVGSGHSLVDFNRGGTPLVEIVTEPDIRSSDEARRFLQLLRQTIVESGISDAEMEKGTLRVDANVSVRERGEEGFRTRWELKNVNSFNFVARGIDAAVKRQIELYESGGTVEQHTYDYEPNSDTLTPHRAKEEADDYRYFPEPDLVPVRPERETIERLRGELGDLPGVRITTLADTLGFATAQTLVMGGLDSLWAATRDAGANDVAAANVIANQLVGASIDVAKVNAAELAKLVTARNDIPRKTFDDAIAHAGDEGFSADPYLAQKAVADTSELEPIVDKVIADNPDNVDAYRGGKQGLLGFFVGQVMKATNGQADARVVNELLRSKLEQ
jgi:aspartyl-tRNA(Asn)/glutamyl-tRNA(Gln) amidotransferase subunit B